MNFVLFNMRKVLPHGKFKETKFFIKFCSKGTGYLLHINNIISYV